MAWFPIDFYPRQFENVSGIPASGYVLKAYDAAFPSSPIAIATDNTGVTTVASVTLNSMGYPSVSGNVIIPYLDRTYNLSLYPSQAAADSNTGAIWSVLDKSPITISNLDDAALMGDATAQNITVSGTARFNADVIIIDSINDTNNNELIKLGTTVAAVNEITISNAATGNSPTISGTGSDVDVAVNFQMKGNGGYTFKGTSSGPAYIMLAEDTDNGTNYIALKAPANITTNKTWEFPQVDVTDGFWKSNGFGVLSLQTLPTPIFSASYASTAQTITAAGALTLAHGLGTTPKFVQAYLKCTSAELNYSVNDEVFIQCGGDGTAGGFGISLVRDATNLNIRFGATGFILLNKTTGAQSGITNNKWNFYIQAWA